MAEFEGLDFSITTKSVLIVRDLDLLGKLSLRHRVSLHMTATTLDEALARRLEPKAPPPLKRLEAVRELAAAGIRVGISVAPILPGLTDSRRSLETLAEAAALHGAQFLFGNVLFLMSSAMAQFMPFLEKEFPHLARCYRTLYRRSAYLSGEYKEEISKLVVELRARYGLTGNCDEPRTRELHKQFALAFG